MRPAACASQSHSRGVTCPTFIVSLGQTCVLREGAFSLFFGAGAVISGIFWEGVSAASPKAWSWDLHRDGRACGIPEEPSFNG